jgi:hypothetical protein
VLSKGSERVGFGKPNPNSDARCGSIDPFEDLPHDVTFATCIHRPGAKPRTAAGPKGKPAQLRAGAA